MNPTFVFPSGPVPRPPREDSGQSRNSNTLRASVLDVALELGIGSSSLVADWMFNNAVQEEDEVEVPKQSEEAPPSFPDSQSSKTLINVDLGHLAPSPDIDPDAGKPVAFAETVPDPPVIPPIPTGTLSKNKLKKSKKATRDGYESEGSEAPKKKKKAKEDGDPRKRKRSFVDAVRGKKDKDADAGYATDGSSLKKGKSKSKPLKDDEYETDGGTKKSKKSFFKLSRKSSKPDLTKERAITPPVPQLKEQMPLPIALRFATATPSLPETTSTTSDAIPPTTSPTPLNLPSLAFKPLTLDVARPPSPSIQPSPVSFPSSGRTIRDSQTSESSLSSGLSNQPSRTSTSVVSAVSSSSFTSPATSQSHFPISSPRSTHGSTSTTSQHSHGAYAAQPQTQRMDTFSRPVAAAASRPTSPPSSAAAAAAVAGIMSFQIARDVSTVPLIMRQQLQEQQQSQAQVLQQQFEHVPLTTSSPQGGVETSTDQVETYPRRMSVGLPATAPLNINKVTPGLRIKPSLEKINLLPMRKDTRELNASVPAGSATPSLSNPAAIAVESPPLNSSVPSQYGHAVSPIPIHPPPPPPAQSISARSPWNAPGRPLSPPQQQQPNLFSPHTFISAPNTATATAPPPSSAHPPPRSARPRLSLIPPPPLNGNLVAPNVLAYYDIPPPSPPPMGPLPVPPQLSSADGHNTNKRISRSSSPIPPHNRSRSPIPPLSTNHNPLGHLHLHHPQHQLNLHDPPAQFPSAAQLRQRMLDRTPRRLPLEEQPAMGVGLVPPSTSNANMIRRGRESPFPPAPLFVQRSLTGGVPYAAGATSGPSSDESAGSDEGGVRQERERERERERPPRSPIMPGPLNNQEKRVLDSVLSRNGEKRHSWVDFGEGLVRATEVPLEGGLVRRKDEYEDEVRGSLDDDDDRDRLGANRSEESAYSYGAGAGGTTTHTTAFTRSLSPKFKPSPGVPSAYHAPPLTATTTYAWDNDSTTVGDRTSRWSGSIYSRMSIMDEDESNDVRDRFVQRVEAMLAEGVGVGGASSASADGEAGGVREEDERNTVVGRQNSMRKTRERYVPPVPKIPDAFVGGSTTTTTTSPRRFEPVVSPGRMWNKF